MAAAIVSTPPAARLDRHRHAEGYAALVLEGGYCEAGDAGRFRVGPGDVLLHGPFEAHRDDFGRSTTRLIDLPLPMAPPFARGTVADPDAIVRLAERDPAAAGRLLLSTLRATEAREDDWPDRLAADLRYGKAIGLSAWAASHALRPGSVSRGFRAAYGVSPQRYRLEARARLAARRIAGSAEGLAAIAADTEFADQAHMTRAVRMLTGRTPRALRDG